MNLHAPSSAPSGADLPEKAEAALKERYREAVPGIGGAWNETIQGLLGHRSVRAFLPQPLEPGTLETLVAAAQSAATSSFMQGWSVIAVEDAERRARLAALVGNQKHVAVAPLTLVFLADLARLEAIGKARGVELVAADYFETFLFASLDAAIAAQNAVAAAESLGLGTVYIGSIRNKPAEVAAELGLPQGTYAVVGLTIGHPDPDKPASVKPRLPQEEVLHREQYTVGGHPEAIARHDAHANAFRREQGLPDQSWSDLIVERLSTVEALKGRHILREWLVGQGFPLK